MNVSKMSAFSNGLEGGNPAGVVLLDQLPSVEEMQACAADVGFSETVFAANNQDDKSTWRARYFSPETEVPFCGHATIALGAVLAREHGGGTYNLSLNAAEITVEGSQEGESFTAALQSPPTQSRFLSEEEISNALNLFGLSAEQLNLDLRPGFIHGGANHYMLALKDRSDLASMSYDLERGREFMLENDLITIMLVHRETDQKFNVRNAFASGGVIEDPATGAAAAAFGGYLRDLNWPHGGLVDIIQGEDMGLKSLIKVVIGDEAGSSIRVFGTAREMAS